MKRTSKLTSSAIVTIFGWRTCRISLAM